MIRLFISFLSLNSRHWANKLIEEALQQNDNEHSSKWLLASQSLLDIQKDLREKSVVEMSQQRMLEIIETVDKPSLVNTAGEVLGWLGDLRNLKTFIRINGGHYSLSLGNVKLNHFEISKYLVTNLWYIEFINDNGYGRPELWSQKGYKLIKELKLKKPLFWGEQRFNCPNFPVVGVSWFEAKAFTLWLTQSRNDGYVYRLPSEFEWESAASGNDERIYPWGDHYKDNLCNNNRSKIVNLSSVGIFCRGDSPAGVSDLCGNTWEWTERSVNKSLEYTAQTNNDKETLATRGGSWQSAPEDCKTSARQLKTKNYRGEDCGFRCLRVIKD